MRESVSESFSISREYMGKMYSPISGYLLKDTVTGEITGCGFDHLKTVWDPTGNASVYMRLGGSGKSLTISDLTEEWRNAQRMLMGQGSFLTSLTLIEYVTSIVIPRERASAVEAFEREQYEQEHGKPWGFVSAKWIDPK